MVVKVVGYQPVDIPGEGRDLGVKGTSIFYTYTPSADSDIIGEKASKVFLRSQKDGTTGLPEGFKPGCAVNLDFNERGKLHGLNLAGARGA
jgi:hypothetical protein